MCYIAKLYLAFDNNKIYENSALQQMNKKKDRHQFNLYKPGDIMCIELNLPGKYIEFSLNQISLIKCENIEINGNINYRLSVLHAY